MFISKEFDAKLKMALELYNKEKYENYPPESELKDITFSEEFKRKMEKLIKAQRKPYFYMINTVGKRVAIIFLSFIIALTATTFGVKAIRESVIEFITETFEKFTRISVEADAPTQVDFEKIKPDYIPEGYYFEREFFAKAKNYSVIYRKDKQDSITYIQRIINKKSINFDTEDIEFETIYINGFEGIIYENKEFKNLIFATEDYGFTIIGKISREEIIKIAESIKIK